MNIFLKGGKMNLEESVAVLNKHKYLETEWIIIGDEDEISILNNADWSVTLNPVAAIAIAEWYQRQWVKISDHLPTTSDTYQIWDSITECAYLAEYDQEIKDFLIIDRDDLDITHWRRIITDWEGPIEQ